MVAPGSLQIGALLHVEHTIHLLGRSALVEKLNKLLSAPDEQEDCDRHDSESASEHSPHLERLRWEDGPKPSLNQQRYQNHQSDLLFHGTLLN